MKPYRQPRTQQENIAPHHATGSDTRRDVLSRRSFLATSAGLAIGTVSGCGSEQPVSCALITDIHYADKDTGGTRNYRASIRKTRLFAETLAGRNPTFAVELGDIIDKAALEDEIGYVRAIKTEFASVGVPCHAVIGNHDVATFSKDEFLAHVGGRAPWYSFDHGAWHFVVLDANFSGDGTPYDAGNFNWTDTVIPPEELSWLASDLAAAANRKTVCFIHQNLHDEGDEHGVKNAAEVRGVLEEAGTVAAVFQGHMHWGGYAAINGIHYVTLKATVEGDDPSFALVTLDLRDGITVEGFGREESRTLTID
jgi:hypothetical protein